MHQLCSVPLGHTSIYLFLHGFTRISFLNRSDLCFIVGKVFNADMCHTNRMSQRRVTHTDSLRNTSAATAFHLTRTIKLTNAFPSQPLMASTLRGAIKRRKLQLLVTKWIGCVDRHDNFSACHKSGVGEKKGWIYWGREEGGMACWVREEGGWLDG